MSVATFDFTDLIIKAQNFNTMEAEADIYSEWKRLVLTGPAALNAGAPPAFETSVGGNDIGDGQEISPYFFIRNDLGWRFEGPAGTGELTINGNLFSTDSALETFQADAGVGQALIKLVVSPQSITDKSSAADLRRLVQWFENRLETDPVTGKITLYADDNLTVLLEGFLFEDIDALIPYRGKGAERRNRVSAP